MIIEFLLDGAHSHLPRVIVTRVNYFNNFI